MKLKAKKLPISEIFGPTIQGEGALAGSVTHFIRFTGCDNHCVWCDSQYAARPASVGKRPKMMTAMEITSEVNCQRISNAHNWVTFTGGNPALYNLTYLVKHLLQNNYLLSMETQGTAPIQFWYLSLDSLTLSPKPPSAKTKRTLISRLEEHFTLLSPTKTNVSLKVVIANEEDYRYAKFLHNHFHSVPIYLQPCNLDLKVDSFSARLHDYRKLCMKVLADSAWNDEVRVLPQLHVLIWGNETGV